MSNDNQDPNGSADVLLSNQVGPDEACPICGQTDVDHLLIDTETEEHVTCLSCGHRYELRYGPAPTAMAN